MVNSAKYPASNVGIAQIVYLTMTLLRVECLFVNRQQDMTAWGSSLKEWNDRQRQQYLGHSYSIKIYGRSYSCRTGGVMHIDEPCCGFQSCKYHFDGNCTSKIKYESCEYMHLKFFLYELRGKLKGNEELEKTIDAELYGQD